MITGRGASLERDTPYDHRICARVENFDSPAHTERRATACGAVIGGARVEFDAAPPEHVIEDEPGLGGELLGELVGAEAWVLEPPGHGGQDEANEPDDDASSGSRVGAKTPVR